MSQGHKHTHSVAQNHKAQLANAYNELGKELTSNKIRVVGNYTLGKVIGEGAYGKVRMGTHRLTSTRVAIKQIPKAMSTSLTREIHHHRQLHHPHVTQMYEVIATESSIWLVTELCCGGELFDYLAEKGRLAETEARIIFGQLCLAVAYLHENGIVHRDLKLENVLLDERCRVKLGDFGFTREFERGALMETFCGTTGYASPEMLQGKKYQGPEVDVWSLGVILYCLLTGTLPFDDDDEDIMRDKIIKGNFEDPDWLSLESRDLIKHILQKDVSKRHTIPQILAHPWFTASQLSYEQDEDHDLPMPPFTTAPSSQHSHSAPTSSEESTSSSTFTPLSEFSTSTPTTPDTKDRDDPFELPPALHHHRNPSDTTIRKPTTTLTPSASDPFSKRSTSYSKPETVREEDDDNPDTNYEISQKPRELSPPPINKSHSSSSQKQPPTHPVRTPARTKRRSVSSTLEDDASSSPTAHTATASQLFPTTDVDFASLLSTPAPIIFSSPVERELLNMLSMMGLDTAQIVHSVLTDACDAAGAVWWMLKKKAERGLGLGAGLRGGRGYREGTSLQEMASVNMEVGQGMVLGGKGVESPKELYLLPLEKENGKVDPSQQTSDHHHHHGHQHKDKEKEREKDKKPRKVNTGVQTDFTELSIFPARSAPQLAFVPPTPTTFMRPMTPPGHPATPTGTGTGSRSLMLSPSSSTVTDSHSHTSSKHSHTSSRSHPSTPAGSLRDREKDGSGVSGSGSKGRKARSGSVSIMQRATTALEAAGLVKKKSTEAVREERERSKETERRMGGSSGEEPRSSHGSGGSSKLTKSPPTKAKDKDKDKDRDIPATPPPGELPPIGSPWVLADSRDSTASHSQHQLRRNACGLTTSPTPAQTPNAGSLGDIPQSASAPNVSTKPSASSVPQQRNRANILTAFRLWFNEDRKGKRKEANADPPVINTHPPYRQQSYTAGPAAKRRSSAGRFGSRGGGHRQRPSASSRRSSSVNSRRSSGTSTQIPLLDSPQIPTRRSFGSHTPNSERGEYSSRPSSVRSLSMQGQQQQRHRKSPSASSAGSTHLHTASPMQRYGNHSHGPNHNHRRAGSGSSTTTRVVRQIQTTTRPPHARSNSATSSLHSPTSSRPASFYELSENEGPRTASPYKQRPYRRSTDDGSCTPRRGSSSGGSTNTTFVAQKRQGPFTSPIVHGYGHASSYNRTSWKKSWGLEPPGWQSRTAHLPVEVLAISPATEPVSIRDVFSGRQSLNMGDESDWVDEDDDIPAFIGGLGQMGVGSGAGTGTSSSSGVTQMNLEPSPTVLLSPAPRGHRTAKRGRNAVQGGGASGKKQGHSPVERVSPNPSDGGYDSNEARAGRRQLPAGRSGPVFRHAIQEEDEGEEE